MGDQKRKGQPCPTCGVGWDDDMDDDCGYCKPRKKRPMPGDHSATWLWDDGTLGRWRAAVEVAFGEDNIYRAIFLELVRTLAQLSEVVVTDHEDHPMSCPCCIANAERALQDRVPLHHDCPITKARAILAHCQKAETPTKREVPDAE